MEENNSGILSLFSFLPEGCISSIIALTTPKDACRASTVSWVFNSASESDSVWERFLPSDYQEIISNSVDPPLNYATKKELFFSLCDSPIIINDGKLSFWLSKLSGKKCYRIGARELSITWVDTPEYWGWTSTPESRFSEVAELIYVCWLDIQGKMPSQMLSSRTTYAAYLIFRVTEYSYGLDVVAKASVQFADVIRNPSAISIDVNDESTNANLLEPETSSVYLIHSPCGDGYLQRSYRRHRRPVQQIAGRVPQLRTDGWMELLLGEFFNDEGNGDIEMKLSETSILNWKKGLVVEGIELRPKEL
ncbi:OLC1v1019320C1 [Oldenlandia corymbosa var. corymbosa]|uniref:OLC1v1019320C1 n=1 Tax=Oldenlandia corymbosa var. corymbosa TaxID=529605 RepID=A0AAV1EDU0_OLDCO|nr:OLC1v1019320C1 [Oldenlandia corymbosa var. corymbosa]